MYNVYTDGVVEYVDNSTGIIGDAFCIPPACEPLSKVRAAALLTWWTGDARGTVKPSDVRIGAAVGRAGVPALWRRSRPRLLPLGCLGPAMPAVRASRALADPGRRPAGATGSPESCVTDHGACLSSNK